MTSTSLIQIPAPPHLTTTTPIGDSSRNDIVFQIGEGKTHETSSVASFYEVLVGASSRNDIIPLLSQFLLLFLLFQISEKNHKTLAVGTVQVTSFFAVLVATPTPIIPNRLKIKLPNLDSRYGISHFIL